MSAPRHIADAWARKAKECLEKAQEARARAYAAPDLEKAVVIMDEALYWAMWSKRYRDLLAQVVH